MKILSHRNIFAMSSPRAKALDMLSGMGRPLAEHIAKCVIYGDLTNNLDRWVRDEISQYISIANVITIKPKDKKLKQSDYEDTLFGDMGDSKVDASIVLQLFQLENSRTKQYPEFQITDDMVTRLFQTFEDLKAKILPILIKKNKLGRDDFVPLVRQSLHI